MGFYRGPKVITNGLVLALDAANVKSYPGSGTTWSDISGNSKNLTLTNSPTFNTNNGGSIVTNGTNSYVFRNDAFLRSYATLTVNIWMYVTSTNSFETYFSYGAEQAGLTTGFGIRRSGTSGTFQHWGGSGPKIYKNTVLSDTSFTNNSWMMVTLVAFPVSFSHDILSMGCRSDILGSDSAAMRIANCTIYTRELSASEIAQNYNAQKSRFNL